MHGSTQVAGEAEKVMIERGCAGASGSQAKEGNGRKRVSLGFLHKKKNLQTNAH
jgi:hypothetical protein